MNRIEQINYETPEITVVEVAVERGFAATGTLTNDFGREGW